MISVYIAAPFDEQENAKKLRDALARRGIGCTSRWLHEEASLGNVPASLENKIRFARMDRFDVRRSQAVVLWNPPAYAKVGTGGRHNESGMGFMLAEMPVFIVGVQSNIFAWLPEAVHVPFDLPGIFTFEDSVEHLVREIKARCPDYGPTWDSPAEQAAKVGSLEPLDFCDNEDQT